MTPCETSTRETTIESGSRIYSVLRVRSTQKLPSIFVEWRASPRINRASTAMPPAAETKFCTVRPSICVR